MNTPPLVTTASSGSPDLDNATTRILYGGDDLLGSSRSGFRLRAGQWLDGCDSCGFEAEYFNLGGLSREARFASDAQGNPILGRPFFNVNPRTESGDTATPREDAELVSTPGELAGSVVVAADSDLQGAGVHLRYRLFGDRACVALPGTACCVVPRTSRLDLLLGYRYLRLSEGLHVTEDLDTLQPPSPLSSINDVIHDDFRTRNNFHGTDLGLLWQVQRNPWSLELLGRLALGTTQQVVSINGSTLRTIDGVGQLYEGGLLAQSTNIGEYSRQRFSVIPELGATLGWKVTPRMQLTLGYTVLLWSRVVRPGDQIDRDINPDYLPPAASPLTGIARPQFGFRDTSFWAQGLNLGAELHW